MVRHISMFTMNPKPADGSSMEENIRKLIPYLRELTAEKKGVRSTFAAEATFTEDVPEDAPIAFPQVIQVLDFETPEDAAAWPVSVEHRSLQAFTACSVKKVTAMDFVVPEKTE